MTIVSRIRRSQSFTLISILYCLVAVALSSAAPVPAKHRKRPAAKAPAKKSTAVAYGTTSPLGVVAGGPWTEPTYADSTDGDNVDGEDLEVRRAAVEALGPYNGSVVVVDPENGRILSMVNQKLALSSGFQPCSTVKVSVALAALSDKVSHYARLFGYGEKAGLNVTGEQPGKYPSAPPKNGGVGMLCSFGEEIQQTPLQLAALISAVANGGTLYYLQYPRTQAEAERLVPRI